MISVQQISKSFNKTTAVDEVSFTVKAAEMLVLLGTSGSGKTTTLRMINRLIAPDSGRIFINEENIMLQPVEQLRKGIGYVLQNYGLFPHFTVAENIAIVPRLLKWSESKIQQRTDELLHKLQLSPSEYIKKYPANLSGGQKQRVGLARALAADPPILLMDEPFGALDTLTRMAVRRELKDLDELKTKTIILVTHDVQEAFELGDTIGLMDQGRLEQLGKPEDLLFNPANTFIENFLKPQRLQLELQSLSVHDIWEALPASELKVPATFDSAHTLWEALDFLVREKKPLNVHDKITGGTKEIRSGDIFKALTNR